MPRYMQQEPFQELDRIFAREEDQMSEESFWLYFDIKEGISGSSLLEKLGNGTVSPDVVAWICGKVGCEQHALEQVAISGLRDGLVEEFFDTPEVLKGFHECVRGNSWRNCFGEFFERILWYLAAPTRERT